MWALWLLASGLLALAWKLWRERANRPFQSFPGPKPLPFLGNILDLGLDLSDMFLNAVKLWREYGTVTLLNIGPVRFLLLTDPRDIQAVLSDSRFNYKGFPYNFIRPWLGTGLLTSNGEKWHKHRKLITPTFHFKILKQMTKVFDRQGDVLIAKLKERVDKGSFDVCDDIDLYTQDVICESAMGVNIKAQSQEKISSKYVNAVKKQMQFIALRSLRPWLYLDCFFKMSTMGRKQKKTLETLHGTTNDVIRQRKRLLENEAEKAKPEIDNDTGMKKRFAFLDLLLLSSDDGKVLSDTDIREEVDTFMFEGHDTTATGICFTLYELSRNAQVQEKVYEELQRELGNELSLTFENLHKLKYLECVVKEGLRLYPSVPIITRKLKENLQIHTGNLVVPAGCIVAMAPFGVHRHPEFYHNPENFDPDHFLPENAQGRHAYAYIPFSAGPRNCIGQKFAMLELKSVMAKIIWNFKILPVSGFEPHLVLGLTLKSKNGILIELVQRNKC